jgi:hypothetical protein
MLIQLSWCRQVMNRWTPEQRRMLRHPKNSALLTALLSAASSEEADSAHASATELLSAGRVWELKMTYLFKPEWQPYAEKQAVRQTLDRIISADMMTGITLTTPDGHKILLQDTIVDQGSEAAIISEEQCLEVGIHIYCVDLPGLKTISGELTSNIIGRTGPLVVSLALGSSHPAHLPIPNGALVMKGNAGGLYKFCLDKQTLHSVYGYVDPALSHLLFRPLASEGNMTLFNGIPTTSVARGGAVDALRKQGLLAPLADDQSQDDLKEFSALASALSMPAADLGTPSVTACHAGQVIQSPVLGEKTFGSSAQIQEASVPSNAMAGADPGGTPGLEALSVQEQSQESQPEASGTTRAADKILSTPSGPGCEASASWLAAGIAVSRSLCSGGLAGIMMLLLSLFFLPVFLYQALVDKPTGGLITWLLQVFFYLACVPLVRWVCLGRCRLPVRPSWRTAKHRLAACRKPLAASDLSSSSTQASVKPKKKRPAKHKAERTAVFLCSKRNTFSRRVNTLPFLARLLFCVLLYLCSYVSPTAAMIAGVSLSLPPAGTYTGVPQDITFPVFNCFAACADGAANANVRWYQADPTALDLLAPDGKTEDPHDSTWSIHPEGKWVIGNHPEATPGQLQKLEEMLKNRRGAFAYSLSELPGYQGPPVEFKLMDPTKRMWCPARHYTDKELEFGDEKVAEMLQAGICKEIPTDNPHASAITLPMKRAPDGSWTDLRFCIDLRQVNANTVVDKYGMPLPEELFRKLRGAKYLAKIDLRSGFWQLRLSESAQQQVAFWWRNRLYTYTRLPFGHVNATALFQRVIETELYNSGVTTAAVFVDDVVVWSDTMEDHIATLDKLFKHFEQVGLRAHPAKTVVAAQTIGYLGHLVSATHCMPEEAKLAGIKALQPPTSVKRLQAHLGLFNYYRHFVPEFARIAEPLYKLLQKDARFVWTPECQQAYDSLKAALCRPGVALAQPDPALPFHLYVDWSTHGIAAVLNQRTHNPRFRQYQNLQLTRLCHIVTLLFVMII